MANFVFFDTETDGLHIINNKPFSYQLSHLKDTPIYLDATPANLKKVVAELSKPDTWLIGHNIKFDCHMLINMGVPITLFKNLRLIDTMFMARLAVDHDVQTGNPRYKRPPMSLSLTNLSLKYLGVGSKDEEKIVREEYKKLNTKHQLKYAAQLLIWLSRKPTNVEVKAYYNMTEADLIASDYVYDNRLVELTQAWFKDNPRPSYKDIPDYVMKPYATMDIILTRGLFIKFYATIKAKGQLDILVRESKALYPLLLMEREGLVIDKEEAKIKYKELYNKRKVLNVIYAPITILKADALPIATHEKEIIPRYKTRRVIYNADTKLYEEYQAKHVIFVKGEEINTKSSVQMAALYSYETGQVITTANKQTREEIEDISPSAKKIQLLRPLDKIIDTYLYRLINQTILVDGEWKLFGTYNNLDQGYGADRDTTGTVTGRLSSDLQQFPKSPLLNEDGTELVNIRRLFIKPKKAYAMMYFDMSQLELRLQTIWSAVIDGVPDKTMARGFGPYDCHEQFDSDGNSMGWFLNEDPTIPWHPTDFHTATAYEAFHTFPDYEEQKEHYRSLGKRANFAIGYGASKWKLMSSLKVTEEAAVDLIAGWKKAYVGLTHMESYLKKVTRVMDHQTNLFGRKYYTREVHKLKNWLVQGSGGDLLKIFLARMVPFVEKYPHWRLMLTVHDEIDFVLTKEPTKAEVEEVLSLMYYEAGGIEVTADADITFTSWADAEAYML